MQVLVKMNEQEIKEAISSYVYNKSGVTVDPINVVVEVKSKQNYKSEWEEASVRCEFTSISG